MIFRFFNFRLVEFWNDLLEEEKRIYYNCFDEL